MGKSERPRQWTLTLLLSPSFDPWETERGMMHTTPYLGGMQLVADEDMVEQRIVNGDGLSGRGARESGAGPRICTG